MEQSDAQPLGRKALATLKRRHKSQSGWQQRKSEFTQRQLLEATVRCIVRLGFAQVRTRDIAEEAGLSRGAIVHHFANKGQLFEKTLVYVHERRLERYANDISQLKTPESRANEGLELYWQQLSSPYFVAAQELQMAARSDEALAAILRPQRKIFRKEWELLSLQLFPEWSSTGPVFDLVLQISRHMMEGMASDAWFTDTQTQPQLLGYLKNRIKALREGSVEGELDPSVQQYLSSKNEH